MADGLKEKIKTIGNKVNFLAHFKKMRNSVNRQEKLSYEIYWGMVFNSAIANSRWFTNQSLNPGRWAAGYPFLYILYRIYNDIKPRSILEFGLGESTKLTYQYKLSNPEADITIVEQNKEWADFFSNEIHDIHPYTKILEVKKQDLHGYGVNQYQNFIPTIGSKKFDLICVDGPIGSPGYSRYEVVRLVENGNLAEDFIILLDDCGRPGEKRTAEDLKKSLKQRNINFCEGIYAGVDATLIICSVKYRFLVSL